MGLGLTGLRFMGLGLMGLWVYGFRVLAQLNAVRCHAGRRTLNPRRFMLLPVPTLHKNQC